MTRGNQICSWYAVGISLAASLKKTYFPYQRINARIPNVFNSYIDHTVLLQVACVAVTAF